MFYQRGVPKKFAKFSGKHLCRIFFFNKVASLWTVTIFEKWLRHRSFPIYSPKIFKNTCFLEHRQTVASTIKNANFFHLAINWSERTRSWNRYNHSTTRTTRTSGTKRKNWTGWTIWGTWSTRKNRQSWRCWTKSKLFIWRFWRKKKVNP